MEDFKRGDTASWDARQVRHSQEAAQRPPQRRRRRRRVNPVLYILFVLIVSAILAGVGWLLASDLCAFNKDDHTATIQVTADDTMGSIADKLKDEGLIKYKWFFRLFAGVSGAKDKIGIGTYELNTDMDYRALISAMHNASGSMNTDTVRVTIPEGYTVEQIIALLAKNGVNTEEALTEAAQTATFDYSYIDNSSEDISRLEGYLFPDTYDFYLNKKPANALGRLIKNFNSKLDDDLLAQAEEHTKSQGHSQVVLGQGPHYLFQGVPEENPGAVEFFQKRGYQAAWSSVNMRLDLAGYDPGQVDIPPVPEGVAFRLLEADRVLHKVIHAPVALLRVQIACAVRRFDQCQDAARVVCFCAQEFRDGRDVLHQTGHVAERVMIDLLQNIAAAAGRHGQIRRVDMPAAIRLAGDRLRVQAEAAQNFKQRFAHLIAPFSSFLHLILPRCGRQQVFRICAGSDKIQAEFEKTVVCGAKLW